MWGSMEMKINLGNYESLTIAMGGSMDAPTNTVSSMRHTRSKLMNEIEQRLGAKAAELRAQWSDGQYS